MVQKRFSLLIFTCVLFGYIAHAQSFIFPLDLRPPYLSANFGELRPNHFHSGIDFKTEKVEGKIVRAIDSGYIARVQVLPSGYGKVLYINHPNGFSSVYAHLKQLDPRVDSLVKLHQYAKQVQRVDLSFAEGELPVAKGEQIALSGNTGSSGGPHLHFEIRKTENQHALNPFLFYDFKDNSRPKIMRVGVYPLDSNSFVNHKQKKQLFEVVSKGNGVYALKSPVTVWGNIGFSVQGYDYMPEMSNIYGFHTVSLICNGQTIYSRTLDEIDFNTTNDINSLIDYEERLRSKRYYERMFVSKNNDLEIYTKLVNRGVYQTTNEDLAQCEIRVADFHGNTAAVSIYLQQKTVDSLDVKTMKTEPLYNSSDSLRVKYGNFEFFAGERTFFDDFSFEIQVDTTANARYYSPVYKVVTNQSIFKKAAKIAIPFTVPAELQGKAIIENCSRKSPIMTKFDEQGRACASIKSGGSFAVAVDTVPPTIKMTMVANADMSNAKYILFKMSDNYSGVAKYNAYIDGVWQILDFDAKSAAVFLYFDDSKLERGKTHQLRIVLEDLCKNVIEKEYTFYR